VSELDLEKVLYQILEQLEKVVPYDSASVFIAEGDYLQILAARGFENPAVVLGMSVPRSSALFPRINQTRQPLILQDAQQDPRFQGWAGTAGYVRGWMGVPLIVQGEIIGEITVDNRKEGIYGIEDARLVMDFATEASIAIQHARLYQRQMETAKRLSILHQASQQVLASLDPLQLYQAVHSAASQVMSTEAFVIAIQDDYGRSIEVPYLVDRSGISEPITVPTGSGLSGYVIRSGKSILVANTGEELEFETMQFGDPSPILSFLAVPLRRLDGGVFGMMSAQSYEAEAYDQADLELLELLGAHAAIALDNTRLFGELQRLAIMDELTGLYNRRHFFEVARLEFDRARRYRRPLSIIMADIDHFKQVNDRLGHLVGDQVLRVVSNRCVENMRDSDVVGRYGGEEFIVLLPETGPEGALQSAERLRMAIAESPIVARGESVRVTISIGLASLDANCTDLDHLIMLADESLYAAKARGRNIVG
jgi:diguanylate cyclase (GGDEF)-like protein